jgi:DNA-binding MarR family transcriptional regulator
MPASVGSLSRTNTGLASELRVSLMRLARRLRNEKDPEDDLGSNQLSVLFTLARLVSQTIGELANEERVQPPSMTRTVNLLVERGLVERQSYELDRRVTVISLTKVGGSVIDESRRRKEAWLHQRLCELTPSQRQILREAAPILDQLSRA